MSKFLRGSKVCSIDGYTIYEVLYEDGKLHPNVIERELNNSNDLFRSKLNKSLFNRFCKANVFTYYAGTGSNPESQLLWKTEMISAEVVGRNFDLNDEPLSKLWLEYKVGSAKIGLRYLKPEEAIEAKIIDAKTEQEIEEAMKRIKIIATSFWADLGLVLKSFSMRFGKDNWGNLTLIQEFDEKTCELWNKSGKPMEKLIFDFDTKDEEAVKIRNKILR